jgi:ketosteroid isomerase-like protein
VSSRDLDVEVLDRGYEAFSRGDVEALLENVADDVVAHDAAELPGATIHHGRAELGLRLSEFRDLFDDIELTTREFIPVADRIVVAFRVRGRARVSGVPVETELAHLIRMRGAKIVELRAFLSREAALAAAT